MPLALCPEPFVITSTNSLPRCVDDLGVAQVWVEQASISDFDIAVLDPVILSGAFGSGFLIVGSFWAMGKGVSVVLRLLGGR